jgi:predicted TIM-barrel fold metal-dependent hydrolase
MTGLRDAHCHFFSTPFFAALGGDAALARLGWDAPGSAEQLADRWIVELDRHGVGRAALIASVPGDAPSVAAAVARHPRRFVGFFMLDPTAAAASAQLDEAFAQPGMRAVCLFPAMHHFALQDARVQRLFERVAARPGTAVFVHCGALSIGVRKKLGLPSPFDVRLGNPLDVHALAARHPDVPVIVPHFGAGMLREALMLADLCPNVFLDTSSSNAWCKYHPGLTLTDVLRQALVVAGAERLLFGSDSSFFPRGWVADVHARQRAILTELGVDASACALVLGGNFDRLFPLV